MMQSVRRHSGLVLVLFALALAGGVLVHYLSTPVYASRALVRLSETGSVDRARALAKELTQPQLLERTANRLGVKASETELRKSYLFDIQAQPISPREIEVTVWTYSKAWADRWTEALVAEARDFRRVRRRKETADSIRAINKELSEIAQKFGGDGGAKADAGDQAGLAKRLAKVEELRDPKREIAPIAKRIDELGRVHKDLTNPDIPMVDKLTIIAAFESASGTGETGSRPAWESIEERRRPLMDFLTMIQFAGIAPDAASLPFADEIEELDRKLKVEFDTNFRRFDVDYRNLVDQKAALEEKAARPAEPADTALNLRLRHIGERIEKLGAPADDGGDPTFAGMRENRARPVSPDALKITLLSLLGGCVLSLGIPVFIDRFGPGRTRIGQLETTLGAKALGRVPVIENLPPRKPALADPQDDRLAALGDVFRNLRTDLLADGAAPRVLMITSATPGEGKTTVAANLGIAFAETGVRTLVIDADMRRGRLHRLFGYRPAPGLADVLAGAIAVRDAIRPTPHQNFYVMNAGKTPQPGVDLLASESFGKTMTQLRDSLDLLIIDAPPVLGLPATAIIAPNTDSALLVLSLEQTSPTAAAAAVEMLRASGAKVRGFVLNRAAQQS